MRFTNAYTPSPICVPARAAFASGRYVHQTGHWDNAMPYTGTPKGWGHQLQGAGISVESIGKLHYRDEADEAGFDVEHIPMMVKDGVGMVWASIRQEDRRLISNSRMLGDFIGQGKSSYTDYDSAVTERTLQWLDQAKDRPGIGVYMLVWLPLISRWYVRTRFTACMRTPRSLRQNCIPQQVWRATPGLKNKMP